MKVCTGLGYLDRKWKSSLRLQLQHQNRKRALIHFVVKFIVVKNECRYFLRLWLKQRVALCCDREGRGKPLSGTCASLNYTRYIIYCPGGITSNKCFVTRKNVIISSTFNTNQIVYENASRGQFPNSQDPHKKSLSLLRLIMKFINWIKVKLL